MKKIIWALILKLVLISILFLILIYAGIQLLNYSQKTVDQIAGNFNSEKVEDEFYSYVEKIKGSNKLQVASIKSIDKFSRKDSKSILWNLISLPDIVVEIHVPVEYNYFINLKDKWEFSWDESDSTIYVIVPKINFSRPAIDISKMEIIEKESSILRDIEKVKEDLRRELTEKLDIVAEKKIPLIREVARKEVKQFLVTWFNNSNFKNIDLDRVKFKLKFEDEIISEENDPKILLNKGFETDN
jgi:hypothetical protein